MFLKEQENKAVFPYDKYRYSSCRADIARESLRCNTQCVHSACELCEENSQHMRDKIVLVTTHLSGGRELFSKKKRWWERNGRVQCPLSESMECVWVYGKEDREEIDSPEVKEVEHGACIYGGADVGRTMLRWTSQVIPSATGGSLPPSLRVRSKWTQPEIKTETYGLRILLRR